MDESGSALIEGTLFDTGDGAAAPCEPPVLVRGGTLSRYLLVERVGLGGMGVVWAAYDPELDRKVAIKLLRPRNRSGGSEQARTRLIREAQAMARLNHANVMAVHDVGEHGGQVFVAMEFVQGKTLGRWVRATRRDWSEIVAMFVQAGRGLAEAHRAGLVHRDFKPANVLVGPDGRPRVTDFGLARSVEATPGDDELGSGSQWSTAKIQDIESNSQVTSLATPLTRTGSMLGTPAYMAPEQFESGQFDARSDQFSFCVAVWEALHRQRPFGGQTVGELSETVCRGKIEPPPGDSRVPGFIDRALRRGLAVDPAARWPSMDALLTELSRDPAAGRRRWLIAVGVVASFAAALIVTPLLGDAPTPTVDSCPSFKAEFDGVWDPARREELGKAVLGTGGDGRGEQWMRIAAALDDYAARWLAMREDVCEAGQFRYRPLSVRAPSSALVEGRLRCLENGRQQLAVAVDLLEAGEASVIDRAAVVLSTLPSLEACGRSRNASAIANNPDGSVGGDELEPLRRRLAEAQLRAAMGDPSEVLSELQALEREARAPEFVSLRAEVLAELGLAQLSTHSTTLPPEQTRALLEQAVTEAIRTGQDALAARAATGLIELLGHRLGQPEQGLRWAARVEAWNDRLGAPAIARARRLLAEGVVWQHAGDSAAAEHAYLAALERLGVRDPGSERPSLEPAEALVASRALAGLAQVVLAGGDPRQARAWLRPAHALRLELLGDEHGDTAQLAAELAAIDFELGDWTAAAGGFARAMPIMQSRRADQPDAVARMILDLAWLRLARAELVADELVTTEPLVRAALDSDLAPNTGIPEALLIAARLDRIAGHLDQAEQALEQVAASLDLAEPTLTVGIALALERGELLLARRRFEHALVEFEKVSEQLGAQRRSTAAEARAGRGRALLELGRLAEARIELEQAVAIWDELAPQGHPRAIVSLGLLASLAGPESRYRTRAEAIRAGVL